MDDKLSKFSNNFGNETNNFGKTEAPDKVATKGKTDLRNRNIKLFSILGVSILILGVFIVSAFLINDYFRKAESDNNANIEDNRREIRTSRHNREDNNNSLNRTENSIENRRSNRRLTGTRRLRRRKKKKPSVNRESISRNRRLTPYERKLIKKYRRIIKKYNQMENPRERAIIENENNNSSIRQDINTYRNSINVKPRLTIVDIMNYANKIGSLNGFYEIDNPKVGKRDPNLLFVGEQIILPNRKKIRIKKNDSLWKYAFRELKSNYKRIFNKILYLKKKIRNFKKRVVDNFQEVSIMKKEIIRVLKKTHNYNFKLILKSLLKKVERIKNERIN